MTEPEPELEQGQIHGIIGTKARIDRLRREIAKVAKTKLSIVISGDTGVGKSLVARAIHNESPRKDKIFMKFNCGGWPEDLIDSLLFGHAEGSFTGALRKIGLFRVANKGTLFLDEIGNMPLYTQVRLLTVLDDGEVTGLGEEEPAKVDVRIISATNESLAEAVEAGKFREDLYHRLVQYPIHIEPLRKSVNEIDILVPELTKRIQSKYAAPKLALDEAAMKALKEEYKWPGNVRELEHVLTRIAVERGGKPGKATAKEVRLVIARAERTTRPFRQRRAVRPATGEELNAVSDDTGKATIGFEKLLQEGLFSSIEHYLSATGKGFRDMVDEFGMAVINYADKLPDSTSKILHENPNRLRDYRNKGGVMSTKGRSGEP